MKTDTVQDGPPCMLCDGVAVGIVRCTPADHHAQAVFAQFCAMKGLPPCPDEGLYILLFCKTHFRHLDASVAQMLDFIQTEAFPAVVQ